MTSSTGRPFCRTPNVNLWDKCAAEVGAGELGADSALVTAGGSGVGGEVGQQKRLVVYSRLGERGGRVRCSSRRVGWPPSLAAREARSM